MTNLAKFTLRVSQTTLNKLEYMANYNERSKNKEVVVAINRYIRDFENLHGRIVSDKEKTM